MENCLLKREEWWLSINILSPTLPQRYIDRLSADLPERPEELFNSLDRALLPAANTIPANDSHGLGKVFMTRVIEEMWRLGRMQGGERYALLLFLKFQLEYLHVLKDGTKDYHRRRHESKEINLALADLLAEIRAKPTNIYIRSHYYRQNIPYFNAVAACRRLRKAMETFPCKHRGYHPDDDICIHKNLAAALHLLQKCAYAEVGSNVLRAVGKRLPKEISDHVREFVMLAEQVPMDPRVLVTTGNWGVGESRSAYSCPKLLIKKA
ncbi:hypothetical protein K505DRAFT_153101 [Melanomma pulvis-pyrius CBS 109.77]|uniref:Uncharacterized protein n=1 Tax=Melanomma pulvis-pyrius CBS 109.77 TaxID=1314802 RepID=A0A6A6XLC8_9PLEO|nr:hypothetical protein K505DRAFT_153101 [Melanomma pulvis-pyrius CBS 109.77]